MRVGKPLEERFTEKKYAVGQGADVGKVIGDEEHCDVGGAGEGGVGDEGF